MKKMMNKHHRILLFFAGLLGAASVGLAAAGAHGFHDSLAAHQQLGTFAKAVDYAMYGALALVGVVALSASLVNRWFLLSGYVVLAGTLLFSGSLFLYTLAGLDAVTSVTPVGGMLLIVAWLSIAVIAIFSPRATQVTTAK